MNKVETLRGGLRTKHQWAALSEPDTRSPFSLPKIVLRGNLLPQKLCQRVQSTVLWLKQVVNPRVKSQQYGQVVRRNVAKGPAYSRLQIYGWPRYSHSSFSVGASCLKPASTGFSPTRAVLIKRRRREWVHQYLLDPDPQSWVFCNLGMGHWFSPFLQDSRSMSLKLATYYNSNQT